MTPPCSNVVKNRINTAGLLHSPP